MKTRPGIHKNKKGDAAIFAITIISLVIIGLIYIGIREATEISSQKFQNTTLTYVGGDHEDNVNKLKEYINYYPIIVAFILLLWGIIWTKNRKSGVYT